MSALGDIQKALGTMPPPAQGQSRFVIVGASAKRSLDVTAEGKHYDKIGTASGSENYPIIETDQFDGWEIVDRASDWRAAARRA